MKFLKFLLRGVQTLILLATLLWLVQVSKTSGGYLLNHFSARLFGKMTAGTIQEVRKNPLIEISGNYLARVSFVGPAGESLMADFRYGEPKVTGSPAVSVVYLSSNPKVAILNEDGGYFSGTLQGLLGIFGFLALLLTVFISLDWWLFRRRKTAKI